MMSSQESFDTFKKTLVDKNEQKYGAEIRQKYGDKAIAESNARLIGLSREQFDEEERLRLALETKLEAAFQTGDPAGALAQEACDLHRQWLCLFYPKYNKTYHQGLGQMYVADERFRANYDKIAPGCTEFFRDAITVYCGLDPQS